jgi:hypothetical protein
MFSTHITAPLVENIFFRAQNYRKKFPTRGAKEKAPDVIKKRGVYYFSESIGFGDTKSRVRCFLRTQDPDKALYL